MVPERLVDVMEDFDRKNPVRIGEGSIGEEPVVPKWEIDSVQAEHGLRLAGVDGDLGRIKLGGKGFK